MAQGKNERKEIYALPYILKHWISNYGVFYAYIVSRMHVPCMSSYEIYIFWGKSLLVIG